MKAEPDRGRTRLALWLLAGGFAISVGVALWFAAQAASTPEIVGSRLDLEAGLNAVPYGDTQAWGEALAPFTTLKWVYQDASEGWAGLAVCLGLILLVAGLRYRLGNPMPFVPAKKSVAPLAVAGALLIQYPLIMYYFSREVDERACCPPWADSAIIPIVGLSIVLTAYAGLVVLVLINLLHSGRLPAPFWGSPAAMPRQVGVGIVTLPLALISLLFAGLSVSGFPSGVVFGLVCAWALMIGRAAALAREPAHG